MGSAIAILGHVDLFKPRFDLKPYTRTGAKTREIAFPLGGIATGCVSLDGRGGLCDWEIFGKPNKRSKLEYTFPSLWVHEEGSEPRALTVLGPRHRDWIGDGLEFWEYGHGRFFHQMDGLPQFDSVDFAGPFPVARIRFGKAGLPLDVELAALNPFIPNDVEASSYPGAILVYKVTNTSDRPIDICLAWSVQNPISASKAEDDRAVNERFVEGSVRGIKFSNLAAEGGFAIATDWPDIVDIAKWSEEGWWDSVRSVWNHFRKDGTFGPEPDSEPKTRMPGSLGLRAHILPGESVELPFVLSWRIPKATNYWSGDTESWTQHYATVFSSATEAACELLNNREALTQRTLAFEDALCDSSLPTEVIESVAATSSILHSPTVIRYENGDFWAWEGCSAQAGCCDGTCSHVWNYAVTHAFLFPTIQKSFLTSAFGHGFDCGPEGGKGGMRFRIPLPMAPSDSLWHAASDGQLGQIVQAYRDWRLTGEDAWVKSHWTALKQAMAYAWVQWDRDRDGLVDGDMHNTYDINFQGPNPLTQFFYLAALRAMASMADHLGDPEATKYTDLATKGAELAVGSLWNGEFFYQVGDFTDPSTPRYQHGAGCLSDQLFGQLAASLAGLGHLADPDKIKTAVGAIFHRNFRNPLGDHENLQRVYAMNDEAGLLLCTWPNGGQPYYPFVYSDEVWTGIEYQVATHLALEGYEAEAVAICKGIRDRYDGERRNPWNEFECGSHYARAMAAYGLQLALTGMRYDAVEGTMTFKKEPFKAFWSVPGAWGKVERSTDGRLTVEVLEGALPTKIKIKD